MNKESPRNEAAERRHPDELDAQRSLQRDGELTRRGFMGTGIAGIAAGLAGSGSAAWARDDHGHGHDNDHSHNPGHGGKGGRYVLKGGVVLSLDPKVGDFEEADVLV